MNRSKTEIEMEIEISTILQDAIDVVAREQGISVEACIEGILREYLEKNNYLSVKKPAECHASVRTGSQ